VGSVVEVAQSGTISVNFINSNLRKAKVFFDFTTENHVISNGDTEVDY
jgi:hypothetical protein